MELLGVIAIIAIVAAIAAPVTGALAKNLKMMQLDNTAKSVYVAAQQRLSSLESSGELQVHTAATGTFSNVADKISGQHDKIALPSDYQNPGQEGVELFYLDSDLAADSTVLHAYLLTGGDTASTGGNYIIEVSPYTGEVYSVIYWEKGTYTYADIVSKIGTRTRDERSTYEIGYYGGSDVQTSSHVVKPVSLEDIHLQLVNWNDLYVKLTGSDLGNALENPSSLSVEIAVVGASNNGGGTGTATLKYSGNETPPEGYTYVDFGKISGIDNDGKAEVDFLLDSMYGSGNDFATITDNKILPGADIKVSVVVTYGSTTYACSSNPDDVGGAAGATVRPGLAPKTENSLYDSRKDGTAKVSCLRHLSNLRTSALGSLGWSDGGNSYSSVVQTYNARNFTSFDTQTGTEKLYALYLPDGVDRNIDFTASNWQNTSVALQHLTTPNRIATAALPAGTPSQPVAYFTPIDTPARFNNSSSNSFNGKDAETVNGERTETQYLLENFAIGDGTADNTGVFATASFSLLNVYLQNASVSGADNVGALVGTLNNAGEAVSNCHVFVTQNPDGTYPFYAHTVTGTSSVGGLIGTNGGGAVSNCSAMTDVQGSYAIGGFVGTAASGTLDHCSVCGDTDSGEPDGMVTISTDYMYAGGFVGEQKGGSTTYCYAAVNVVPVTGSTVSAIGGFAGGIDGGGVQECYSSGDVTAKSAAGGFAGVLNTGQGVSKCYTTSDVNADSTAGGFAGRLDAGWHDGCVSYGRVLKLDGTAGSESAAMHGFVGRKNAGGFTNCYYLRGYGYNDFSTDSLATAKTYNAIKAVTVISNETLAASDSHPYATALQGEAFPFNAIAALGHYGDWPATSVTPSGNIFEDILKGGSNNKPNGTKDLWTYLAQNTKGNLTTRNINVDSTAPFNKSFAGVGVCITQALSTAGYDTSSVSWRIWIDKSTYAKNPDNASLNGTLNGASANYQEHFVIILGDHIPDYSVITQDEISATYNVVEYDVGRATKGLACCRQGTITLMKTTLGSDSYYTYRYKGSGDTTFTPTSGWYDL